MGVLGGHCDTLAPKLQIGIPPHRSKECWRPSLAGNSEMDGGSFKAVEYDAADDGPLFLDADRSVGRTDCGSQLLRNKRGDPLVGDNQLTISAVSNTASARISSRSRGWIEPLVA